MNETDESRSAVLDRWFHPERIVDVPIVRGIDDLWDEVRHVDQPWGRDRTPTSPKGRHCASCGTELSIYNANSECHCCRAREYDTR